MSESGIGLLTEAAEAPEESMAQACAPAPSRMSESHEMAAVSKGRAHAAMTTANMALRAARERLEHCRRTRQAMACFAAAMGAVGIAALVTLIHLAPDDTRSRIVLASLAIFAACTPLVMCVMRAAEGADKEATITAAMESARMLVVQARRLGEAAEAASDQNGLSPTTCLVIDMLLDDVEQAAATAKGYENRIRGEAAEQGRRHVRIYPRNSRVIVTTGDNRRFTVNILDVSVSGVAVEGNLPGMAVGTEVVIGSRKSKVVRLLQHGAAFEFARLIPTELFDRDIVL